MIIKINFFTLFIQLFMLDVQDFSPSGLKGQLRKQKHGNWAVEGRDLWTV